MHFNIRSAVIGFTCIATLPASVDAQQPSRVRVGVAYASSLMSARDTFMFSLGGTRLVVVHAGARAPFFLGDFAPGEKYRITQLSGPRTCQFAGRESGTIGTSDLVLTSDCGMPPLTLAKLIVTGIAQGEQFGFADNFGRTYSISFNTRLNLGGYPVGDSVVVTPRSGPRSCRIAPARLVVPAAAFEVRADCGSAPVAGGPIPSAAPPAVTPPAGGQQTASGTGTLAAPAGTRVVLARGPADSLVVVARTDGSALYTSTSFTFRTSSTAGVRVRRAPVGLRCAVADRSGGATADTLVRVACAREWEHVTRGNAATATATFYSSFGAVIGGEGAFDGRYVAFAADDAGIAGSSGRKRQVFWRDRWTNTTRLVSVTADGSNGDNASSDPAISADGQSVAFVSAAGNLAGADADGSRDVFLWRAATGKVERVSQAAAGTPANAESFEPSISGDGTIVAFSSSANNLAAGQRRTSTTDVYVKDMRSGEVTLLSREERTSQGAGASRPSISDDGTRVVFNAADALRDDDRNGLWDIYLWQRGAPQLRRLSLTSTGAERNQGDESASRDVAPQISGDGQWVTFATTATNMGGPPSTGQQLYVVGVESGRVSRLSETGAAAVADGDTPVGQGERVAISRDGTWIAFTTRAANLKGSVALKHRTTGDLIVLGGSGTTVGIPMVSRDGLFILVPTAETRDARVRSSGTFVKVR